MVRTQSSNTARVDLTTGAPGVYRQDVFPAPEPSFLTGVPVILGYAAGGPVNEPVLLTLWSQFVQRFAPRDNANLAPAVRGFFENDGFLCYVLRLDDSLPPLSSLRSGLDAISALDGADLICAPDLVPSASAQGSATDIAAVLALQSEILAHCRRHGNRFAILDSLYTADVTAVTEQRSQLNGDYGALYFPWVMIDAKPTYVPPCGHVAGIYSRSDQRIGVHKAPANEVVQGTLDLHLDVTDAMQGRLNADAINCLRVFPGRGIRVWGARTLSDDSAWTYVNIRRLFITVGRWLERFMTEVGFAANDIGLWVRIMRELTAYLEDLFRQGALKGRTPDQAFFVKCDGETNPPEVRDAGMVVAEVGLAPVAPSEFIVTRIIHGTSGVSLTQI